MVPVNTLLPGVSNQYESKSNWPLYNDPLFIRANFPTGLFLSPSCRWFLTWRWGSSCTQPGAAKAPLHLPSRAHPEWTQPLRTRLHIPELYPLVDSVCIFFRKKNWEKGFICNFHLHRAYRWKALQHLPCSVGGISSLLQYLTHWTGSSLTFFKGI